MSVFKYLAHTGAQITDEETNYDVWQKSIVFSGGFLVFFYTFDAKTVTLQSVQPFQSC